MTAAELLGLPPTNTVGAADSVLGGEYLAFTNGLNLLPGDRVVIVSPYQLSVKTEGIGDSAPNWYASLSEQERARLLLLSVISRPFDQGHLWPDGQPRFADDEMVALFFANENPQSLAEGGAVIPYGLDTIPGKRTLAAEPALQELAHALPRRAVIETISSEFIGGQPGNYGYQMWQVCRWSDAWAVVFGVTDAGYDEGYPFPWLLGFCGTEGLQRNFVELLRAGPKHFDMGFYWTYGKVFTRWSLARLALVSDEDSEGPDWTIVDSLIELDDDTLAKLLPGDADRATDFALVERLRAIRDTAEILGLEDLGLAGLLTRADAAGSLDMLESKLADWEAEQEARDRAADEERRRRIAAFADQIGAVLSQLKDPPPDDHYVSAVNVDWHNRTRRDIVRRYIEDYVAERDAMPIGSRDFGVVNIRSGLTRTSRIRIGKVDFEHRR